MRKPPIACIALLVLLLGTATSFGASGGFNISAFAYADSLHAYDEDYESATDVVTAWVSGNYSYEYSLSVSAATAARGSGSATSYAFAEAEVSAAITQFIGVIDDDPTDGDTSDSATDSGVMFMLAYVTIELEGQVRAEAAWYSGSAQANAHATSSASASISLQ